MPARRKVAHKRHVKHVTRVVRRVAVRPSALTKSLKKLYFKSRAADKKYAALPPGKRTAKKSKRVYYEYRVNRADRSRPNRL